MHSQKKKHRVKSEPCSQAFPILWNMESLGTRLGKLSLHGNETKEFKLLNVLQDVFATCMHAYDTVAYLELSCLSVTNETTGRITAIAHWEFISKTTTTELEEIIEYQVFVTLVDVKQGHVPAVRKEIDFTTITPSQVCKLKWKYFLVKRFLMLISYADEKIFMLNFVCWWRRYELWSVILFYRMETPLFWDLEFNQKIQSPQR